jgi:hypothetical protein
MRLLGRRNERHTTMKNMTLVEWMTLAAIVAIAGLIVAEPIAKVTGIPIQYSDGDRTGVVVKLSKKGIIWKTWEGQMNLGAMSTDGNGIAVPSVWQFSVADDAVLKQINEAAISGKRITLHYEQPILLPYSKGSSQYLVTSAKQ